MPLIKSKSKRALQENIRTEINHGKPVNEALGIAYSVKRKAKKASGGSVESGSKDMNMAYGGSADEGPSEKANQKGVNKIVPNYDRKHNEVKHGQSEARYGNKKDVHRKTLEELRNMPKPKLAEGGEISAKTEKRPMPDNKYHDAPEAAHNSAKKKLIDSDWDSNPTIKQAQSNNGRKVMPIKQPKMVPSDAFSTRMRDEEANLQSSASPGPYGKQPPEHDNELDAKKMDGDPDMAKQHNNGKAPYNKAIEDQYAADMAEANMKRAQSYAKGGPVMQPKDHAIELRERDNEMDLQSSESPSEDEGDSDAVSRNEEGPNRQGPDNVDKSKSHALDSRMYHDDMDNYDSDEEENPAKLAEGGHIGESQDNYADDGHEDSIAAAIMSKKDREKARAESGSRDMDEAVRMALGGELLEDDADIHSHGSMDSDDSDQADLSRNADEDANEEDQASFDALRKENYSESEGLAKLDQPMDSGQHGDSEEEDSENRRDMVSSIRSKMAQRRQFKSR